MAEDRDRPASAQPPRQAGVDIVNHSGAFAGRKADAQGTVITHARARIHGDFGYQAHHTTSNSFAKASALS